MNLFNYIMLATAVFTLIIGLLGFLNPNWTRLINFPGGPRLKAIAALVTGIILLLVGLLVNIPME